MAAVSTRQPSITISYATARGRRSKAFSGEELTEARSFYSRKLEGGADPKIQGEKPANWDTPPADTETPELSDAVNAAAAANPGPARIRMGAKTRAYWAGVVIAKYGHHVGITDAMIAEVDSCYERSNSVESEIALRQVWHGLAGAGYLPAATTPAAQ